MLEQYLNDGYDKYLYICAERKNGEWVVSLKNVGVDYQLIPCIFLCEYTRNTLIPREYETACEQRAKRSLMSRSGLCHELVGIIMTYLKLFKFKVLSDFSVGSYKLPNHSFLVFALQFPLMNKFKSLEEMRKIFSINTIAFVVDSWIGCVVSVENISDLLRIAGDKGLGEYFNGPVALKDYSLMKCGDMALSSKHLAPIKYSKYIRIFSPLNDEVNNALLSDAELKLKHH